MGAVGAVVPERSDRTPVSTIVRHTTHSAAAGDRKPAKLCPPHRQHAALWPVNWRGNGARYWATGGTLYWAGET